MNRAARGAGRRTRNGRETALVVGNDLPSLAVVRSLAAAGYRVIAGDGGEFSTVGYSRDCHEVWVHPPVHDAEPFLAALAALHAARPEITTLLPLQERYVALRGEPHSLELNPRHGAAMAIARHCGLDLTLAAIDLAARGDWRPDPVHRYPVGRRYAWTSGDLNAWRLARGRGQHREARDAAVAAPVTGRGAACGRPPDVVAARPDAHSRGICESAAGRAPSSKDPSDGSERVTTTAR